MRNTQAMELAASHFISIELLASSICLIRQC